MANPKYHFGLFFLAHEEVKAQKKRNYEITLTVLGMEAFEMSAQRIL
jgi:hypothetical protein